jgi:O-antigen/teichoic acid export membrane protein
MVVPWQKSRFTPLARMAEKDKTKNKNPTIMGIVRRQGIQSFALIFIGFVIGAVNILVLFPRFFSQEEFGLSRVILDAQLLLASLCTFGSVPIINKFYPFYESYTKKDENDLPFLSALICTIGFILLVIAGYIFDGWIIRKMGGKSTLFNKENYFFLFPATFFWLLFIWLEAFAWGLKKTVTPNFLKETLVRLLTTVLIVLFAFHHISFHLFMWLFSLLYAIPCVILIVMLVRSKTWKFNFRISALTRRLKPILLKFMYPAFAAGSLNLLARTADTFLLTGYNGLTDAAIFTVANYVVTTMDMPFRSIVAISTPILAESWKNKNIANIYHIYSRSTITLLLAGILLFGIIWLNLHNLEAFLPEKYKIASGLIFVMSISKLIDLGTGLNGHVLAYSNYRLVEFYTNLFFTIVAIPLNAILIKNYGLMGAAVGSMISLTLYNLVRFVYVWYRFKLQPFTHKNLLLIGAGIISITAIYFIPHINNLYIDTIMRTICFSGLFMGLCIALRISPDINHVVWGNIVKLSGRLKR